MDVEAWRLLNTTAYCTLLRPGRHMASCHAASQGQGCGHVGEAGAMVGGRYRFGTKSDEAGIEASKVEKAHDHQGLPVCRPYSALQGFGFFQEGQLLILPSLALSNSCSKACAGSLGLAMMT